MTLPETTHPEVGTDGPRVPFNRPSVEGRELEHIREAIENSHSSAKGPFSARVTELLRESIGAADVLMTTSCTAALEMSGLLLDLRPGDVVIVPSFTFVTTALAFTRAGARLLFADIEDRTLGIDPDHLADLLGPKVRAVVPVHYAGVACEIERLTAVIDDSGYRVDVIEDNAHGLFGTYRDESLGSFGRFATLSFHETKNFACGEGGALIVNDATDVERAHVVYDKGTNRRAFMLGTVDKYSWVDEGSSFGMSDLLAAYLLGQLEAKDRVLAKRSRVFERYDRALRGEADGLGFRVPDVPPDRGQAFHMYYVLMSDRASRDRVLAALNARGYQATFHYVPLHESAGAQRHVVGPTACPVTEDISGRLLRLPFFNDLADEDIDRITEIFLETVAMA